MLRSVEDLDSQTGPEALFNAPVAQASPIEGFTPTGSIAIEDRSIWGAAFQQSNVVGSILSSESMGVDNRDDGTFDPVKYVHENNLLGYEDSFYGVLNANKADAIRNDIRRSEQNKETLAASGWAGTLAGITAGVIDLPTLIPGGAVVRSAKGGYSIGKSMLMTGVAAGGSAAAAEAVFQQTDPTRTGAESTLNIAASTVLGSLLGGGAAALLGGGERALVTKALDEITDIQSGVKPNSLGPQGVGADVAEGAFFVDPIQVPRSREDLDVAGTAAGGIAKATAWFNPVLRSTQRYSARARQYGMNVYESTVYRNMHMEGETTGAAVETAVRTRVDSMNGEALAAAESAYREARKSGVRMSRDNFYEEVGRAMRNNDEHAEPAVARAAQAYRKMFDDMTKDALDAKLLDEKDLDVKTAASYFSRYYNKERLLADEPNFLETIGSYVAKRMKEAHQEDAAKLQTVRGKYATRAEDLGLSGPARASRIEQIKAEGDALDASNAQFSDAVDRIREARGMLRNADPAEREALRAEIRSILAEGGDGLDAYMRKRAELRSRYRDLTATGRNADAATAAAERVNKRIQEVEDGMDRSLTRFGQQMKNLLNESKGKKLTAAQATELRMKTQASLDKAQRLVATAQAKLKDLPDGPAKDEITALLEMRQARLTALEEKLTARETREASTASVLKEVEETLTDLKTTQTARSLKRGAEHKALKDKAAKLTPDEVKKLKDEQSVKLTDNLSAAEERFAARWEKRLALGLEEGDTYDFEAAAKATAREVYDKITGKVQQREDVPSFLTKITTGPLKDRTFTVPDELLAKNKWLVDDVREVGHRYSRAVAGEVELTRRFGRADMKDQLAEVAGDYAKLRQDADKATSIEELNTALGRNKFSANKDLAAAKIEAQKVLASDEAGAITDLKAGRDLIRGSFKPELNHGNFASISRSLMHFNYIRSMGGVLLSNLSDFYRPAFVHGLKPYLSTMPKFVKQAFGAGGPGVQLSIKEAQLAGLVYQRVVQSTMAANGDIADPFIAKVTHLERLTSRVSRTASRWNFINAFTDAQQSVSSALSQHRILSAVMGKSRAEGSLTRGDDLALLRMLGIDETAQKDIAALWQMHGETVDGIEVANTEKWLTGSDLPPNRAERAVRVYRQAVNMDVNSIISRKGLGDGPLFGNTPLGKLMFQFSGYSMGAHQRVMMRGLQEGHARMIGGLSAMTAIGGMTAALSAWRGGRERWEKWSNGVAENPMLLLGEGLDRSGFFPLLFEFANRTEKVTGAVGSDYRFNPVKSPIAAAGGGNPLGITSSRGSDSSAAFGALLGPTAGLVDSALAAGRVAADAATGQKPPKSDINQALAVIPFNSYYGMRELLQVMTGNSNYVRE